MTSSRTSMKAPSAWIVLVALLALTGVASAGRKRIVVLEFEGDKAEKFHADVVKLIKKSHTVVSLDKWNGTAEEMSATKLTDKNVKKVARKLKVDGVVSGVVEKRRDEYILRMKLRSGVSGELVGSQINIKAESAKIDSTAAKDVKDELIDVIADLESNRAGGGGDEEEEEEEEKPKKGFVKKPAAEEEEEKPKKGAAAKKPAEEEEEAEKPKKGFVKKPAEEEEEKPKKGAAAKKPVEEEEEKPKKGAAAKKPAEEVAIKKPVEEKPKKPAPVEEEEEEEERKPERKPKKVARIDEEEEEGIEGGIELSPMGAEAMYAPGERAVDAVAGMSFTARRLSFAYNPMQVVSTPAGYRQSVPVPGFFVDATVYPLAMGHKRKDILRHLGATVMFDRVLAINSKNPADNTKLKSTEQRFAIGAAFRYPLGTAANAPVVGAALRYGQQQFAIDGMSKVPDVKYSMIDFTAFVQYTLAPKMLLNASAGALLPLNAGEITTFEEYGRARITGFEGSVGLDYRLMKNIFARAEGRFETLGYAFLKEGAQRAKGIGGARDSYFGGVLTAGYLF
jgi:hypothetical protein